MGKTIHRARLRWVGDVVIAALLAGGAALAACSTPVTANTGATPQCVPGKVDECPCPSGAKSTQTCDKSGSWGGCLCGGGVGGKDAADGSSGAIDGGGPGDGALIEDGTLIEDGATSDGSGTIADGGLGDAVGAGDESGGTDLGDAPIGDGGLQSGDGMVVSSDIPAGVDASQACQPCGYGSLKGLICSPSEQVYIANATVTLTVTDCDGSVKQVSTQTAADGSYAFAKLPCGKHIAQVTAGKFSATYNINIKEGQETNLTGIGTKLCFKANSAKIAVWWGQWDEQTGILDKLGFSYTYYNYKAEWMANVLPKDIDACKALQDPSELKKYDILFFNCGSEVKEWISEFPSIKKNLHDFVMGGGSIYGSDLAWAIVEAPFPDAVDFYGKTDLPNAPSNDGPQVVAGNQSAAATIKDAALAAYVGTSTFTAKYGPGPLIAIQGPGAGTTVHVTSITKIQNPAYAAGGWPPPPEFINFAGPAVISFQPPGSPKAGRVVYTTFHNDEQADALMQKILNYLVFLL